MVSLEQQIEKIIGEEKKDVVRYPFGTIETIKLRILEKLANYVCILRKQDGELLEKLAELEHKQWCHWIDYQEQDMDEAEWERWIALSKMTYAGLTEQEKESDREWARKVLKVLGVDNK